MKVFKKILYKRKSFFTEVTYRLQYSAFTNRTFERQEGETIVYVIPNGVKKLKIDNKYYSLDKLDEKSHEIKAKAICELLKRREQKYFLKYEGIPIGNPAYKKPPKRSIYGKGKSPVNKNGK